MSHECSNKEKSWTCQGKWLKPSLMAALIEQITNGFQLIKAWIQGRKSICSSQCMTSVVLQVTKISILKIKTSPKTSDKCFIVINDRFIYHAIYQKLLEVKLILQMSHNAKVTVKWTTRVGGGVMGG